MSRVDGGVSAIKARKQLDSRSNTLTREMTPPSVAPCGESSSKSVSSHASLKSQACPLPVSPVESHMISEDHPICAAGKTVHSRSSARTKIEKHERIVTTTPYKYEDDKIVNKFAEILRRLPLAVVTISDLRDHSTFLYPSVTRTVVNTYYT